MRRFTPIQVLKLGIVCWQRAVEHANVLVVAQWHPLRVQKSRCPALVPNEIVPPVLGLGHHKLGCEHALRKQHARPIGLQHAPEVLPQRLHWNLAVPFPGLACLVRHAIRKVSQYHVNRTIRQRWQNLQAIVIMQLYSHSISPLRC